jgi:hypothetical protein
MPLTERDRLFTIRGISIAAGLFKKAGREDEYNALMEYCESAAEGWGLKPSDSESDEFLELVRDINLATAKLVRT